MTPRLGVVPEDLGERVVLLLVLTRSEQTTGPPLVKQEQKSNDREHRDDQNHAALIDRQARTLSVNIRRTAKQNWLSAKLATR